MNTSNTPASKTTDISLYDAKKLGITIRLLRERAGLTQTELAELSGISAAEISRIEKGSRKKPPINTLIRIAPRLNVSLDYLLVGCIDVHSSSDDHERYFDLEGSEIDLYTLANYLYSKDAELLLLLSDRRYSIDERTVKLFKEYLKLRIAILEAGPSRTIGVKDLFDSLNDYLFKALAIIKSILLRPNAESML